MKIKSITEKTNKKQILQYPRTRTNLMLAGIIKSSLLKGSSRLRDPLENRDINVLKILDSIKSQSCIRVGNYNPDKSNEHLSFISLGPSYLEQQISKAIENAVEDKMIPKNYVPYLRAQIGLDKEQVSFPKMPIKEEKIQNLPDVKIPINLPALRQSEHFSCGATALQMIAAYYGKNIRESDLINNLGIKDKSGVKMSKIQKTANDMGFDTNKKSISYESIKKLIDKEIPTIVAIQKEKSNNHHFVVCIGYYDGGIVFRDPSKTSYGYLTEEEFKSRCYGSNNKYLSLSISTNHEPSFSQTEVEKS